MLIHCTPRSNLRSIRRSGLLPERSLTTKKVVFLIAVDHTRWAIRHVAKRHGVDLLSVTVIRVDTTGLVLTACGNGVYTCDQVVCPARLTFLL